MQRLPKVEGIPEIVPVRRPITEQIFVRRAARFRSLAAGNPLGEYLTAMAWLADAQQAASTEMHFVSKDKPLPGEYPYHAVAWHRDESWRMILKAILSKMEKESLPPAALRALKLLSESSTVELEASADALLSGNYSQMDLPSAPFMGAALQVYWTALAKDIVVPAEARSKNGCPVCASPPVAGVVQGDSKLRYLECELCSTEWYLPRLTCSNCGSTEGLSYLSIENDSSGAKAECCARCHAYLKLFYLEASPATVPIVDDVATFALDALISEEGFSRIGPNFYLLPEPSPIIG